MTMHISKGAAAILKEARAPWRDREKLRALIDEYGIDAAAEALELLGQVVTQGGNTSYDSRRQR
jgi:hypothetical protein